MNELRSSGVIAILLYLLVSLKMLGIMKSQCADSMVVPQELLTLLKCENMFVI